MEDFARAGATIDEDIVLPAGPLKNMGGSMEPLLRKLGLPTKLADSNFLRFSYLILNKHNCLGVIELTKDFPLCKAGDELTPVQSQILKLFNIQTMNFRVNIVAHWSKKGFTEYKD